MHNLLLLLWKVHCVYYYVGYYYYYVTYTVK